MKGEDMTALKQAALLARGRQPAAYCIEGKGAYSIF